MGSWFVGNSSHYLPGLIKVINLIYFLFVQFLVHKSQLNIVHFSERDPVQDEVPRLCVSASLLPGGP